MWRKHVKFFFSGLKKNFKKKIPPRFLDCHRVSVENYEGILFFIMCRHSLDVSGHPLLSTKEQTVSGNTELFMVRFNKVFICLDCEQVLIDQLNLENHLLFYHNVVVDDESCEESGHPGFHQNDCNSTEVVFFCSLCSASERDESLFTEHMTIVHDLPKLEESISVQCRNATATVSMATAIKVFRYKIIDPQNVFLVDVCPNDNSRLPHKVSLKALVGVPGMVNLSQCPVVWQGLNPSQSGKHNNRRSLE